MPRLVRPRAPFLDDVEPARGVAAADHGADRGADDDVRLDAVREQGAKHADMSKAARPAAAKREPDGRAHRCALRRFGCRLGAAIPVSSAPLALVNQMCSPSARDDHAAAAAIQAVACYVKALAGAGCRKCGSAASAGKPSL